jgi:hypothetical protein
MSNANPTPTKTVYRKTNPYLAALGSIGAVALVLGGVGLLVSISSTDAYGESGWVPAALTLLVQFGVVCLLLALTAAAITWRPDEAEKNGRA